MGCMPLGRRGTCQGTSARVCSRGAEMRGCAVAGVLTFALFGINLHDGRSLSKAAAGAKSSCKWEFRMLYSGPLDWALWRGRPSAESASYPQVLICLWIGAPGTSLRSEDTTSGNRGRVRAGALRVHSAARQHLLAIISSPTPFIARADSCTVVPWNGVPSASGRHTAGFHGPVLALSGLSGRAWARAPMGDDLTRGNDDGFAAVG